MPDVLLLLALIGLPFGGAVATGLLPIAARNAAAGLAGAVALACLGLVWAAYPTVSDGGVLRAEFAWMPGLGLNFVLRMDGFAWLFAGLVTGIGALVVLYARYYMSSEDPVPRFFAFLLAFMGAMTGLVVSGNLVQLAFFWELTSLFSFLLIGYWHHLAAARDGARMALTITATGGLALFAGVLLLGHIVGSYDLDVVLAAGDRIREHPLYLPTLILILLGALTKSAQFPFHFWLPHAMAAPTPVSAYLHSATLVKAGVFLMVRLWPVMAGTDAWFLIVGTAGLITLLIGAYIAIFQNDLKGLLAYSTISHLGLITLLLGLDSELALVAAVFHIMNHAAFKASLFMAAGIIDHETGTRDIRRLSGLNRSMPFTARLALVAAAAMAGVPLLNGFLSKEMFFAETVFIGGQPWLEYGLPVAATLAGLFAVVYSLRFGHDVFFGPSPRDLPRQPHEPVFWMRVPIELLVLACIVVGTVPAWSVGPMLAAAARPVVGTLPAYSLAVWHGWTTPLAMSLVALVGGIAVYAFFGPRFKQRGLRRSPGIHRLDGKRLFEGGTALFTAGSRRLLRWTGTRRLQPQLLCMLVIAGAAALGSALIVPLGWGDRARVPASPEFVLLWILAGTCAIGAAAQAKFHRLVALTLLGIVGLVQCLTYAWFSAPDLALTQIAVEVVTVVLFLLGLRWLPRRIEQDDPRTRGRARWRRGRDLVLAVLIGSGLAALSFAMLTRHAPQSISPFFMARALPEGGGANIVNVMLVDFRAFDTLGEITVLGIVGLAVYALLRRFRPPRETVERPPQQRALPLELPTDLAPLPDTGDAEQGYLVVPAVLVRLLLPVSGVVAFFLYWRGHNEPGGGFVAGLVMAIAFIAQYMVGGTRWVEERMRLRPPRWISAGLLLALVTGLGAIAFGHPLLTSHTAHVTLPLFGAVHLPSASVFDLGVFAVVLGSTLLMLTALAHQSLRARRRQPEGAAAQEADEWKS
jgi:multicomponent K+:H+ antiporter subunit A